MSCSATHQQLNRLADRELPLLSVDRLRIAAHVAGCAGCRDVLSRLRRQRITARRLAAMGACESLPALSIAWPEPALEGNPMGQRLPSLRRAVIGMIAAVAVVSAGFVLLPGRGNHAHGSAAAEVRAALAHVNAWQLSGWKLVQGRRVPWQIWGRRQPFFYREQVGDELMMDDGARRTYLMPPDAAMGRPRGIALTVSSTQTPTNVPWSYSRMVELFRPGDRTWKETSDTAIFNLNDSGIYGQHIASDNLYTVDKRTWLPTQYEVRRGKSTDPRRPTVEFLRIAYDDPIPAFRVTPLVPAGFTRLDATKSRPESVPSENAVTHDGLTVQASPMAADTAGNVILRVRVWLGGERLDRSGAIGFFASAIGAVDAAGEPGTTIIDSPGCKDDAGRAYVSASYMPLIAGSHSDETFLILAPLEPLTDRDKAASKLTVGVHAGPMIRIRASGMANTGNVADGQTLLSANVQITVPLPDRRPSLNPDACLDPGWEKRVRFPEGTASPAAAIEEARAGYWIGGFNRNDASEVMRTKALRGIERQKIAISLMPKGSRTESLARGRLQQYYHFVAGRYHYLHDDKRAAEMLHATLDLESSSGEPFWSQRARRDLKNWGLK